MAIFTLCLAAAQASSSLHVLSAPASVQFDGSAGALPITAVPGVAASALGVKPPTDFTWDGLYAGSVFDRPLAAVTVIVDGLESLESAGPSYSLYHSAPITTKKGVSAVVTGHTAPGFPALASLVSEASGKASVCVSVSADSNAAIAAGHRDLATSAVEHTVYRHGGVFVDSAVNDSPIAVKDFSVDFLKGAVFDSSSWTVTYAGVAFPELATNFFQELQTMVDVANALKSTKATDSSPAVLTFTIASYRTLVERSSPEVARAGKLAVEAVVQQLTEIINEAYDQRAVILAVAFKADAVVAKKRTTSGGFSMVEHMEAHKRKRRDNGYRGGVGAAAFPDESVAGNGTGVPECVEYKCACFKVYAPTGTSVSAAGVKGNSFDGEAWASAPSVETGDVAGCLSNIDPSTKAKRTCQVNDPETGESGEETVCSTICVHSKSFCPCMDPKFDPAYLYPVSLKTNKCTRCSLGYKMDGDGVCYLEETQASSSVNIALWVGLMATGGIAGIWYALHMIGAPMFAALGGGGGGIGKFKDM